jgi:hypothetical protein
MNIKKLTVTTALAASLLIGAGATLAQEETPEAPTQEVLPGGRWGGGPDNRPPGGFRGDGGPRGGMHGPRMGAQFSALVEEYTGLTREQIRAAVQDGQTLADLIEANDRSVEDFVAAAVEQASVQIDEAVAAGRISEERADEIKANLPERITAWVNGEHPVRQGSPEATPSVESST